MDRKSGSDWDGGPTLVTSPDHLTPGRKGELRAHTEEEIPALVELSGATPGRRHILQQEQIVIGRGTEAQVRLDSNNVSRRHALLRKQPSGDYLLEDLTSRNGTLVNDVQIRSKILRAGDRIRLGADTVLLFTHHNPVEEKFLEAQKLESIGRLAGGIAHDFNNIMASLLTDIRFLQTQLVEGGDLQEAGECLKTMESAASRAATLTDQLLGFARGGKYTSRPVDLVELLEEVSAFISGSGGGIEVELRTPGPLQVVGDHHQMRQVLLNLALNARDAMPDGGRLLVTGEIKEITSGEAMSMPPLRAGSHVVISIQDTGVGMSEETLGRAFEPYFTTKTVGQGSGLGLAAVYGILKNHGGHVSATSTPGAGSTFRVHLAAARKRRASKETTSAGLPSVGGLCLLADDDDVVRRATAQIMERMGFTLLLAEDGQQALDLFTKHQQEIRFVILDMFMPKVSGKETFKRIRRLAPQVRVLLTSGYVEEERVQDLIEQEGVLFLQKPYRPAVLRESLQALLEQDTPPSPQPPSRPAAQPIGVLKKK
jgi:two-component system, cell cycle sensor histidine kinase and response regulator CckA